MPKPSVHGAEIFLGREVQPPGEASEIPISGALDAAPQAKRPDCKVLHARVPHQLRDPRVLHEPEEAFLEAAHRLAFATQSQTVAWSRAVRFP